MWGLLSAVLQIFVIVAGVRIERRVGLWSWSKFVFALSFGLLEGAMVIVPMIDVDASRLLPAARRRCRRTRRGQLCLVYHRLPSLETTRRSTRRRKGFAEKTLVTLQVSLCILLLVGAGLFVRTLVNLNAVDPGFHQKDLLLFAITPPRQRYPPQRNIEVLHQIEEKIAPLPGVESVTLSAEPLLAQTASNELLSR